MSDEPRALLMRPTDNVLTALTRIPQGATVHWVKEGIDQTTTSRQIIPFGHKMSCVDIPEGDAIVKYGEPIGRATERILAGSHVHTQNVASQRGRGDLAFQPEPQKAGV